MDDTQDQDLPDKKQTERDRVIAEAMANIKLYVEHGKNEGFVQIKPPKLTRFRLPEEDTDPADCQDLLESDVVQPAAIERWTRSEVLQQVDHIKEEDMQYFGKTLTDELTGEQYMLVPIDVDVLINPANLTSASGKELHDSYELLLKAEPLPEGTTIYVPQPGKPLELDENQVPKVPAGSQFQKHEFKVPKLCLAFELVLAPDLAEKKDSKVGLRLDDKLPSSNLSLSPGSEMQL